MKGNYGKFRRGNFKKFLYPKFHQNSLIKISESCWTNIWGSSRKRFSENSRTKLRKIPRGKFLNENSGMKIWEWKKKDEKPAFQAHFLLNKVWRWVKNLNTPSQIKKQFGKSAHWNTPFSISCCFQYLPIFL